MLSNNSAIIIGNNHHNTLGLVRSLGRGGLDVVCLVVDKNIAHSFVSKSKYVNDFCLFPSFDMVLDYLKSHQTDCLVPVFTTSDEGAEFLDLHYDELNKNYLLNNCGHKQGGISYWMNKEIMLAKAQECGLRIPIGFIIKSKASEIDLLQDFAFPCIVKPHKSSEAGKTNFRICEDLQQLKNALFEISNVCDQAIVQEFINREFEFLMMGMRSSRAGKIVLPGGLHKLRVCKHTKSLGMFAYAYTTPDIEASIDVNAIKRFLEAIDYDGIFSVEFMIAHGKAYFLEINLRNDGTQYCFEGAGVNLPLLWVKEERGEDISQHQQLLDEKYCMVEVNYVKNMNWSHPITALKEWKNTDLFALTDKNDRKPALYKVIYALK